MIPIAGLHGWRPARPKDLLLGLSQTFPLGALTDPYRLLDRWAQLKYVAAFAPGPAKRGLASLNLSPDTRKVVRNQRRVFSEELGLAFAIHTAKAWHRLASGSDAIISIVDIDTLAHEPTIDIFGTAHPLRHLKGARADYVVMSRDPRHLNLVRLSVLESKGTIDADYSLTQLVKAQTQLGQLKIGGVVPPGLAVASVLQEDDVHVNVLRTTTPHGHPSAPAGLFCTVDLATDDPLELESSLQRETHAALRASLTVLAAASGNETAERRWGEREPDRAGGAVRHTISENGRTYIGLRAQLPVPGGSIEVFRGIDAEVDEQLTTGTLGEVAQTQVAAAPARPGDREGSASGDDNEGSDEVFAVSSDGGALKISALRDD